MEKENVFFTTKPPSNINYWYLFLGITIQIIGFTIKNGLLILIGIIILVYGLLGFVSFDSQTKEINSAKHEMRY